MSHRNKYIWSLAIFITLASGAIYFYQKSVPEPTDYLVAKASLMDLEDAVLANGVVTPIELVNIGAQVNGQVKSIMVNLGDKVKAGQLLARIDPVLQLNALKKAEATLDSARARKEAKILQIKNYETILLRQRLLFNAVANSLTDVEQAELNLQIAKTDLSVLDSEILQAKIEVDIAKANYGYTNITAPIDGEIMSIIAQTGQTLVSSQSSPTVLVLGNTRRMAVKAKISEVDIFRAKPGQEVYFSTLGRPAHTYRGKLRAIEGIPDGETQAKGMDASTPASNVPIYYNGVFDVANSDGALKASMNVQIHIVQAVARNALVIPVTALVSKLSQRHYQVHVLTEEKQVVMRSVQIGMISGPYAQVVSGIAAGETVILRTGSGPT